MVLVGAPLTVARWQMNELVQLKSRYAELVGGGHSFSSGTSHIL